MKTRTGKFVLLFATIVLLMAVKNFVYSQAGQISAPPGTPWISSDYVDPTIPDDKVFIFCTPDENGDTVLGTLSVMGGYSNCTYEWGIFDADPTSTTYQQFIPFVTGPVPTGPSSTVENLVSGFYQVIITCNSGTPSESTLCRRAHVFVNQTILEFDPIAAGCQPFTLNNAYVDAVSDFTIYDPPPTPFVVDATTDITVCFWVDHSYVSDLGFYLIGPGGGRVDLLPPISGWDNSGTLLNAYDVLGCDSNDINNLTANSGNDYINFCLSSTLPAGDPQYTPCIANMSAPITGTFASCEGWSDIYGDSASAGGWAVQVYDCVPADIGNLQRVTITFEGQGQCGNATYVYDSGQINESINDGACDSTTAATYVVPLKHSSSHTITDEITAHWESYPTTWDPAWGSQDFDVNPSPTIDPEPVVSTEFCLVVEDHLFNSLGVEIQPNANYVPCNPSVCHLYETLPTDATIVNPPLEICQNAAPIQLQPLFWGGQWSSSCGLFSSGGCITQGGFFFPSQANLGPNTITYSFGGVCASDTTISIMVVDAPEVVDIVDTICNTTNTAYQVQVTLQGGNSGAYSFTDNNTGLPAGTFGSIWVSPWITNATSYSFHITDNNDCDPIDIVGFHDCGCVSNAADMPNGLVELCAYDPASVTAIGSPIEDGNDGHMYVLHTEPYGYLGTVLSSNTTGQFFFQSGVMAYGETYYISQVVGNNIGTPTQHNVDLTDPCLSVSPGTPVMWYEFPTANAGANDQICGQTIQLNADTPAVGVGVWTCLTNTGVIWSPNFNDPNVEVTVPLYDTNQYGCPLNTNYIFRYTVTNGPCQIFDDVTAKFKPQPNAFAGNDFTVCGLQADVQAVYSICGPQGVSEGFWSGDGQFANTLNPNTTVNVNEPGVVTFTWTEFNEECIDQDYLTITFLENPVVDANHNDSVCGTIYDLNAISTMGVGYWEGPIGTVFSDQTSPNSTAEIIFAPQTSEYSATFVWNESNGMCYSSDSVNIVYSVPPNAAAGLDDWICGTSYMLDADVTGFEFAVGTWKTDFVGANFTNDHDPNATISIPNTGSFAGQPQAGSFGDSSYVSIPITWVMDNNKCTDQDEVIITFYQIPQADAGHDTSVCGLVYNMLAEYSIGSSKGKWTVQSAPSALPVVWSDDSDPHSSVQVSQEGEYVFKWKEDNLHNQSCSTFDLVTVYFIEIPDVYAGPDKFVCGNETNLEALNSTGTGTWLPAQAQILDPSSPTSLAHYGLTGTNDTIQFVWQEYNEYGGIQCVSQDSVDVVFMIVPESQVFWTPGTSLEYVCGKNDDVENILVAVNPGITGSNIVNYWVGQDAEFYYGGVQNSTEADPDSTVVGNYGIHEFQWVVENWVGDSVCADTSITITIDFVEQPVANAGPLYDTACGRYYQLGAEFSTTTGDSLVGTWITSSPNQIDFWYLVPNVDTIPSDSLPNCYVSVSTIDNTSPISYELVWQETNFGELGHACVDWDTTIVKFAPKPTGKAEILWHPHCIGYEAKLKAANDYSIVNWDWSDIDDGIITNVEGGGTPADPGVGPVYVRWPNAVAQQTHQVRLITTNTWECFSPADADEVVEPDHVPVEIDVKPSYCGDPNGEIELSPLNSELINTYKWLDTLNTTWSDAIADKQTDLLTGDYYFWARAKSLVSPNPNNVYCRDTFMVHVGDTGYIAALYQLSALADTFGVSPHEVTFNNLSYYVDSNYVSPTSYTVWQMNDSLPSGSEINAEFVWRFYHLPLDTTLDYSVPIEIYPWEVPVSFNGNELVEEPIPLVTFENAGYYKWQMVAISEFGCKDTLNGGYIYTEGVPMLTPGVNVITPNGDGTNDYLEFEAQSLRSMEGKIFDRWGKLIFTWTWNEEDQVPVPGWWDGKLENGQDALPGVYYYVIKAIGQKDQDFSGKEYTGFVHLIREK